MTPGFPRRPMLAMVAAACAGAPASISAAGAPPVARAVRAEGAIRIDGLLDETDWSRAEAITSFTQRYPVEGAPASQPSEVRILYDDEHLYIGADLHDADPGAIIAREMKEDGPLDNDDAFSVLLDTFHDRRNGYFFQTNPNGARADALIFDEGRNNSFDWDGVWEVATSRRQDGWTVEMEIPFKTLHFRPDETSPWGLQIMRLIRRDSEDDLWSPIPRNESVWRMSRAGELTGLDGIRQGKDLEVKPYALGAVARRPSLQETAADGTGDVGLDARYAVTPNLTASLTVNTDFAETEVDDQQVNITRFPLFFPEKREFFLESKGYFDFGYKRPGPGTPIGVIPFFSRRIGLATREVMGETVNVPVPILAGVKLAGRLGRYDLGFLSVETGRDGHDPETNFTVFRLSRDILTRSNWGIIAIGKEPQGPDSPPDPNDVSAGFHSNGTYGADVNFSVMQNLKLGGAVMQTRTPGAEGGQGMGRVYADWSSNNWETEFSYTDIGARFNPEAGFVQRTGIEEAVGFLGWSWRSTTAPIRKIEPHTRQTYTMDQEGDLATRRQHWATTLELHDGATLEVAWNPVFDDLLETFTLRDDAVVPPGAYHEDTWTVRWEGNRGRVVSGDAFAEFGDFFDGTIQSVSTSATTRISAHLGATLGVRHMDIHLPARPGDPSVARPGSPTQGALPPSEFIATLAQARLGVAFTTRIFFDALVQYNTDVDDVSGNLRFNYKYRPGSDLYVVFNERRDIEGLPTDVVDRSLSVKWTYLMSY